MKTTTSADGLLSCPFCGRLPTTSHRAEHPLLEEGGFVAFVSCFCGGYVSNAHMHAAGHTVGQAIERVTALWNTRASLWRPIAEAPLSDPLVVWQGKDWVLAECSEYRGWCDMGGMELDPQPTHYLLVPPLQGVS